MPMTPSCWDIGVGKEKRWEFDAGIVNCGKSDNDEE